MEELVLLPSVLWAHAKRWAWAVSEGLYGGKWGSDVRNCMLTLFIGLLIWSAVSPESWQEDNRALSERRLSEIDGDTDGDTGEIDTAGVWPRQELPLAVVGLTFESREGSANALSDAGLEELCAMHTSFRAPAEYPNWDSVRGCWVDEAGEARPEGGRSTGTAAHAAEDEPPIVQEI